MAGVSGGLFAAGAFALGVLAPRLLRRVLRKAPDADPGPSSGEVAGPARRADGGRVSDLRQSALRSWLAEQAARDAALQRTLLADFRDSLGAEEAVFWRWNEERDSLTPELWSTDHTPRPAFFHATEWAGLVRWSAEERVVQLDGDDPVRFAAAPLASDRGLLGVLSLSGGDGMGAHREAIRSWLPRYAAQLHRTIHVCDMRRLVARRDRQRGALLAGVRAVQLASGTVTAVGGAICETALSATSGTGAALVRWTGSVASVQYVTQSLKRHVPFLADEVSLVAQACRTGVVISRELGPGLETDAPVFLDRDGIPARGSVAVVPIARGERIHGAIVVWADSALDPDELEHVRALGELSIGPLDLTWNLEEVELRAKTDPLTGLGNRRYLEERLSQALAASDRFGQPTALILVDIDHFKKVNDTWGHEAGDHVLKKVAKLLADGVREVDTCVRFGGEEIAILLPQTSATGALDTADRLRRTLAARPIYFQSVAIPVTASFGVCAYPEAASAHEALITEADKALYEAKHAGRNCVRSAAIKLRNSKA